VAPNPTREKRDLLFVFGQQNPARLLVRVGIAGEVQVRANGVTITLQPPDNFSPEGRKYDLLDYAPIEAWRTSATLLTAVERGWLYVDLDPAVAPGSQEPSIPVQSLFDLFIPRPPNETVGDLIAWNGTAWIRVPNGATGQVLTALNAAVPAWQNLPPPPVIPDPVSFVALTTNASSDSSTYEVVGSFSLVGANHSAVDFIVTAAVTGGGLTGDVQLYNLTDAAVVGTLSWTETTPTTKSTGPLSLPAGNRLYEVRIRVTGGTPPADRVLVPWAGFELTAA